MAEIFTSPALVRCRRIGDVARWRRGLGWLMMSSFFACGIFGCFWLILIDDDDDDHDDDDDDDDHDDDDDDGGGGDDGDYGDYETVLVLLMMLFGCPVSCLHHQFGLRREHKGSS